MTITEFKKLFDKLLLENKCPTEEIVKKKYYFPVNQLKVKLKNNVFNYKIIL